MPDVVTPHISTTTDTSVQLIAHWKRYAQSGTVVGCAEEDAAAGVGENEVDVVWSGTHTLPDRKPEAAVDVVTIGDVDGARLDAAGVAAGEADTVEAPA